MTKIWHTSEKEAYLRCGEAYRLRGLHDVPFAQWPLVKGNIIHAVFDRGLEFFDRIWVEHMADIAANGKEIRRMPFVPMTKDMLKQERKNIREQCINFFRYMERWKIRTYHSELTLKYTVAGYPHEGTLDKVVTMPDTPEGMVEIIDFKSGVKWDQDSRNRKMQFGDYYLAATQNGFKVHRMWWGATKDLETYKTGQKAGQAKGDFLYSVWITDEDRALIEVQTEAAIRGINAEIYLRNGVVHNACKMCPFGAEGGPCEAYSKHAESTARDFRVMQMLQESLQKEEMKKIT